MPTIVPIGDPRTDIAFQRLDATARSPHGVNSDTGSCAVANPDPLQPDDDHPDSPRAAFPASAKILNGPNIHKPTG